MNTVDLALWLAKMTLLMSVVWAVYFRFRGRNPRWQQGSFRIGACGIVLLTGLSFLPPLFQWSVVEVASAPAEVVAVKPPVASPALSSVPEEGAANAPVRRSVELQPPPDHRPPVATVGGSSVEESLAPTPREIPATAPITRPWNWRALLLSVWAIGVLWPLCRWSIGVRGVRRLLMQSRAADATIEDRMRRLAGQLGVEVPRVVVSDQIDTPSVVGIWRSTIILPDSIAPDDLDSALAHELCHVAGNDLRWDALLRCLSALLWPHPLVWKVVACHRAASERVCDLVAADMICDRKRYADSLARIAAGLGARPGFGMAMARSPQIIDRLRTLASRITARPLGRIGRFAAAGTMALVVAGGVTTIVHVRQVMAEQPGDQPRTLKFVVLDAANGEPLADAQVAFRYHDTQYTRQTVHTDKAGVAEFIYPESEKPAFLRIKVNRSGYVPYYASFDRQLPRLLPTTKTIRMSAGKVIGGIITDTSGAPIENADVTIYVPSIDPPKQNHVYDLLDAQTGPDGRWTLDAAPSPPEGLQLRVEHGRYQNNYFDVQDSTDATYALERGWSIAGTVTNESGDPVSGVKVVPGTDRFGSSLPDATTDDAGKFELFGLKKGETTLTATADGFAPQMTQVVPDGSETVEANFVLKPGNTIQFRFVDPEGHAIQGAWITADTWRGFRTVDWRGKSNGEGMVTWTGAPSDTVIYDSGHSGYRSRRDLGRIAQDEPHVITLSPEFVVTGDVVDADTGQPIEEFKAQFGWQQDGGEVYWTDQDAIQGRDGEFRLTYDEGQDELFLRVTATGYKPWISGAFDTTASPSPLKISMQPGAGPRGIVLTPDGERASGAVVALGVEGNTFQFRRGYRPYNPVQQKTTDAEGRFELDAVEEGIAGIVAIIHDSGYAEVTLEELAKSTEIQIDRWASLEFEVIEEGRPVAGRQVQFRPRDDRTRVVDIFSYSIDAETDEDGRATLDRVIPTDGSVSMALVQEYHRGATYYSHASQPIQLGPGQKQTIRFGGSGRTVVGRVDLPGEPPAKHRWEMNEAGSIETTKFKWDHPEHRTYRFLVDDEGRFRIPDVPTGAYKFSLDLTAQPSPDVCGTGRRIGGVPGFEFEVTAGDSNPVDLGELTGEWDKLKGVGDPAVNFVAKTDNGKVTLDQFSGKVVLLDFWATWCAPCLADMPRLLQLHRKFGQQPNFELLAVSLDQDFQKALRMADDQSWPWVVAEGGRNFQAMIPRAYDVESLPVKFLIGRDGTILYRGNDLAKIESMITDELAEPTPAPTVSLKMQASPVADDFQSDGRHALVALALSEAYISDRAGEVEQPKHGLFFYDSAGKLIRSLPTIAPSGWLKRPDRITVDRQRGRLYALTGNTLHACADDGRLLYQLAVPSAQAVSVQPETGDLWVLRTSYLNAGTILVLSSDGDEIDRHPVPGFSLRHSAVDNGFWMIGKSAKLVSPSGDVVVQHSLPDDAYTFAALAIDPAGGCWALEDSHPDVPASREQLWHISKRGMRRVGEFGVVDHNTYAGLHLSSLAVVGDQVWVSVIERQEDYVIGPNSEIRRYAKSGELLGTIDELATEMHGSGDGTVWATTNTHLIEFDADGNELRRQSRPSNLVDGVHQSSWLMTFGND
ncbi:redoxin domain-containing protein [Roseiconus nitratireducens]|uniref:Redoxin domain-containing protein n=1 Tax=Roseiconus nitratireducens TaxID=2605748 RepID=A0A5M6DC28_9BACT|nr:carboxypeptidase regulatory-like domain-containing protein [Roseiconus nitratireducens]KAA5542705.1 redoxin domain-containing protein [Roseiconus nitratireducens]